MRSLLFALFLCSCGADYAADVGTVEQAASCWEGQNGDCVQFEMIAQKTCRHPIVRVGDRIAFSSVIVSGGLEGSHGRLAPACAFGFAPVVCFPAEQRCETTKTANCSKDGWNWTQTFTAPFKRGRSLYGAANATRTGIGAPPCTEAWLVQTWW